jgi:hypothetical protein
MVGAIAVIILLLLIPVIVMMSGAAASAALGWVLGRDAEVRHEGSELIELNR